MPGQPYNWDFFLSHAGADLPAAKQLLNLMKPHSRVFLDEACLDYGDDWDTALAAALDSAQVVVVMVSARTEKAFYEGEEIATALHLTRQSAGDRRVVPLYLDDGSEVPFGLRRKHSIYLTRAGTLEAVAESLLAVLRKTRSGEIKLIEEQENALSSLTTGSGKERLDGLREITAVYRPLLIALLAMTVITLGLIVFYLVAPSVAADRYLIIPVLAAMLILMLTFLMKVFDKSLDVARDIARGALQTA